MTARMPRGLGAAGRELWHAVVDHFDIDEHEVALLRQAVHVADLCDALQAKVTDEGVMLADRFGQPRAHPAAVELRQQRLVLARLIVALRVPLGDDGPEAEVPSPGSTSPTSPTRRLQRRGLRGVYGSAS